MSHTNGANGAVALSVLAGILSASAFGYPGFYPPAVLGGGIFHPYFGGAHYPQPRRMLSGLDTPWTSSALGGVMYQNALMDPSGRLNLPYTQPGGSFSVTGPMGDVGLSHLRFPQPYPYYGMGF